MGTQALHMSMNSRLAGTSPVIESARDQALAHARAARGTIAPPLGMSHVFAHRRIDAMPEMPE